MADRGKSALGGFLSGTIALAENDIKQRQAQAGDREKFIRAIVEKAFSSGLESGQIVPQFEDGQLRGFGQGPPRQIPGGLVPSKYNAQTGETIYEQPAANKTMQVLQALGMVPSETPQAGGLQQQATGGLFPGNVPQGIGGITSPAGLNLEGLTVGGLKFGLPPAVQAEQEGRAAASKKEFESIQKLGGALRQMATLKRQFNEAIPSEDRSPFQQRIQGTVGMLGARTGLIPNARLQALDQTSKLVAIQIIRSFGEVGNLSQTEQESAIRAVDQSGLTEEERDAVVRNVGEFALNRASTETRKLLLEDPEIQQLITSLGITLGTGTQRSTGNRFGRSDGQIMVDAQGNRAIVYPDGSYEELP